MKIIDALMMTVSHIGDNFETIDYFTFFVSVIILFFAHKVLHKTTNTGKIDRHYDKKLKYIRISSAVLIGVYLSNIYFGFEKLADISQTFLTILTFFILNHWANYVIINKYGTDDKDKDPLKKVKISNYVTQIISMSTLIFMFIITFITLLNVWGFSSSLETTSAFGVVGVLLFATKDYWVDSVISAFIVLSRGHIPRGALIRIPSDNVFGIIQSITFSNTCVKDLACGHDVYIPTSHLRTEKYEVLANDDMGKIKDFIEFKIGYKTSTVNIQSFFNEVFSKVKTDYNGKTGIDFDTNFELMNMSNGDHAVTWRFYYTLKGARNILKARGAINQMAYENQENHGLSLDTPITHTEKV